MINCNREDVDIPEIKNQRWTTEIYKKLGIIFHNKCYLCETKEFNPATFEVDHFISQSKDLSKKLDWNNLYLACRGTCNQYKSASFDNILDPCSHDVEKLIIYELTRGYFKPRFYATNPSNIKITNTCKLLDKIHKGNNKKSIYKTKTLQEVIRIQASFAIAELNHIKQNSPNTEKEKKEKIKNTQKLEQDIKEFVSRESPYTMLMRSLAERFEFKYLFD